MFDTILVAIGANLASIAGRTPLETCRWAVGEIEGIAGVRLGAVSRWYATPPIPASDQPTFVNGVVRLVGNIDPAALLQRLHGIEDAAGRQRSLANAARTLDLDLLAMDGLVVATKALTLPHPRMQDRAFVLAPLLDVAPGWTHPVLGITAAALLEGIGDHGIEAF